MSDYSLVKWCIDLNTYFCPLALYYYLQPKANDDHVFDCASVYLSVSRIAPKSLNVLEPTDYLIDNLIISKKLHIIYVK